MHVAIDSYSYHRFFGEMFPGQTPPSRQMTVEDFLARAHALGVGGVSLESCFLPSLDDTYMTHLRSLLDEYQLERVLAWGHPRGLEAGKSQHAYAAMIAALRSAQIVGAGVLRVVSSNRVLRSEPHGPQLERLTEMYRQAVRVAEEHGIKIAIENHLDFNSEELLQILNAVNSPYLGITFDSGNFVRWSEDPVQAMERLGPYVYATHIKDLVVMPGVAPDELSYYTSVPIGEGIVDNRRVAQMLHARGYQGLLAIEVDLVHPDYADEDIVIERGVAELKRIVAGLEK